MTRQLGVLSAAAVIPAAIGMIAGQRFRRGLSETRFRQLFFISLCLLGLYLIVSSAIHLI